tara:strand:+ start:163 stop:438 length:276 start_codon:yes stop_codon:yes gene_type:complete
MACRSSGVLTANTLVTKGQCKLVSIHATAIATATTIKVYDALSADPTHEIARLILASNQTIEFDMHGVICSTGIFVEEVAGGAMACSIEFN